MIIQLPCKPQYREQVNTVIAMLGRELPSYVQPGIQIYRGSLHESEAFTATDVKRLVSDFVPREFAVTLHAPISPHEPDRRVNLLYEESEDMLRENILLAEDIHARLLTLHTNTVFHATGSKHNDGHAWADEMNDETYMDGHLRKPVMVRLQNFAKSTEVVIGVENMPIPIKGDATTDPDEIKYEPLMNTCEDLARFSADPDRPPNLKITYDTSHGIITRAVINDLLASGITNGEKILTTHYRGIYPESLQKQPTVSSQLKMMLGLDAISDIQLSDAKGLWVPYRTLLSEGNVLGEGMLGDEAFEIARYVCMYHPDVPVSIDVEEKDYINRPNQRESIRRIVKIL